MLLVRTFVLVCCLAVPFLAHGRDIENGYAQVDLKEFSSHPAEFEGRRVVITAEIVSVSADARTLNVFDNGSKTLVGVSLAQLSKAQRQTLVSAPVHRVSIYGRVEVKNGRAVIKADQVMPLTANLVAQK
ncbi:MAG: hypothetical protein M3X11_11065 [Acidobacteriota bacterium]|nr:hypothetical protein [Acidobacteriota bacterium]